MAKGGDKRRLEQNAAQLRRLQLLIAGANVAFILFRLVLRHSSATKLLYAGWVLTAALYAVCYRSIAAALAPVYGVGGVLLYSGQDLSVGGALSYFHDCIYIALLVQLLGCLTDWAWLAFLLIPGYGLYMLTVHVLIPYWQRPRMQEGLQETELDRKRREKKERQAARAQKFAARR